MTVTARYIAWLDTIGLPARQHLRLALMETALLFAWAVLLDSILRLFTSLFLNALPVTMLIAANLLAWLESPRVSRLADPLTALGLAEVDRRGRLPSGWRTLLRVILTPPSLVILLAGFVPIFFGRRSLPEAAAGVRLVSLDPSHDPRPLETILRLRSRNRKTVLGYTFLSLAIAALILFVPLPGVTTIGTGDGERVLGLSSEDTELLTLYLEMTERFPDSIEYHVRLASLYYRNDMDADLAEELRDIARLDPGHPLLLLAEDVDVDLSDLVQPGEEFLGISETGFGPGALDLPEQPDSTADSTAALPGAGSSDSIQAQPALQPDAQPGDTIQAAPEEPVQSRG
jgi:hypothetical protein